jgi:predicted type IV restriction endonuclease
VKGEFDDYGIRIDKELVAFIECKRIATKLAAKHLRQAQTYALNEGVEWVLLTNGAQWQAYHITAKMPIEVDLALEVDLLGEETSTQKVIQLFYLTRESLNRRQIDELWKAKRATSPQSLATVLTSEAVLTAIRKELRRETGYRVTEAEIADLLRGTVLRPECFSE